MKRTNLSLLLLAGLLPPPILTRAQEPAPEKTQAPRQAAQDAGTWVKVVEAAHPALVIIETEERLGGGFFIRSDGTLVTNHHVVEGAREIQVKLASGEIYRR